MNLVPLTRDEANAFIGQYHRHSGRVQGHRGAIGCEHDGVLIGVAILARPVSRALNADRSIAEVVRLCVSPGAPRGTCSWLYGRIRRVASALGFRRLITYTLASESGASLRGAGWSPVAQLAARPGWDSPARRRGTLDTDAQEKIRWEVVA